jgi:hypothetical protein
LKDKFKRKIAIKNMIFKLSKEAQPYSVKHFVVKYTNVLKHHQQFINLPEIPSKILIFTNGSLQYRLTLTLSFNIQLRDIKSKGNIKITKQITIIRTILIIIG